MRGRSLGDLVKEQGPLGPREAALIGIDLCRALAAVHRAGLVHRDVKAHNVMRQTGGRILLMDFGTGSEASYAGAKATPQSDLCSLGVLLYHLVTGAYPVSATNAADLRAKVLRGRCACCGISAPTFPRTSCGSSTARSRGIRGTASPPRATWSGPSPPPSGARRRLSRLALGDNLSLEFRASREVHLYVINEDERGRAYALFPLPDLDLKNPMPAGRTHVLPGTLGGRSRSWVVNTAGGREHLLLLASPDRLVEFEAGLSRLPRPEPGGLVMEIPDSVKIRLRGIGALGDADARSGPSSSAERLFALAERLAGTSENAVGAWLRRIDLDNPEP